jgi:hypothetical protein
MKWKPDRKLKKKLCSFGKKIHIKKKLLRITEWILKLSLRLSFNKLCFITEKENWIGKQLQKIDEAITSVPMVGNFANELLKIFFGLIPSTKDVFAQLLQIFLQRIWKILDVHDVFKNILSNREQRQHFRDVGAQGIAFFLVFNESKINWMAQFQVNQVKPYF